MNVTFKTAEKADLSNITATYNAAVKSGGITADTHLQTIEERLQWFEVHLQSQSPVWTITQNESYCGWMSLSVFYGRPAYQGCKEISLYLNSNAQGLGIGKLALKHAIEYSKTHNIHTLLAFIFKRNQSSRALFTQMHFVQWGHLPKIAVFEDYAEDLELYGLKM